MQQGVFHLPHCTDRFANFPLSFKCKVSRRGIIGGRCPHEGAFSKVRWTRAARTVRPSINWCLPNRTPTKATTGSHGAFSSKDFRLYMTHAIIFQLEEVDGHLFLSIV